MNTENTDSNAPATEPQSPGDRQKSYRRAENMRRINREGLAGRGGRPPEHGEYALVARYKAGISEANPLYPLLKEYRDGFVADRGGQENVSNAERECCEHLAFLAVLHRMQLARFAGAKRMSRQEFLELSQAITRTAATFGQLAKQLGFKRDLKESDNTLVIRRWGDAAPGNGAGGKTTPADSEAQDEHKPESSST